MLTFFTDASMLNVSSIFCLFHLWNINLTRNFQLSHRRALHGTENIYCWLFELLQKFADFVFKALFQLVFLDICTDMQPGLIPTHLIQMLHSIGVRGRYNVKNRLFGLPVSVNHQPFVHTNLALIPYFYFPNFFINSPRFYHSLKGQFTVAN